MNKSHKDMEALLPDLLREQGGQEDAQRQHRDETLTRHLARCSSCQQELALLKELAALDMPQPEEHFLSCLSTEVAKALKSEAPAPGSTAHFISPGLTTKRSWRCTSLRALVPALAACFMLALATWCFLPQDFQSTQVQEALWTEESGDELYPFLDTGIGIEPGSLSREDLDSLFEALNDRNESGG